MPDSPAWRCVRVPASSANLGPGFDALGLALDLYRECSFRPAPPLAIRVSGRDVSQMPRGEDNLIWRTAMNIAKAEGLVKQHVEMTIANAIPLGKGLGSSAAALVA